MITDKLTLTWDWHKEEDWQVYISKVDIHGDEDGADWDEVYLTEGFCHICGHDFTDDWVWQTDCIGNPREACSKHIILKGGPDGN